MIANLPFNSVRYRQNNFSFGIIRCKVISELRAEVRNNINGHFKRYQSKKTITLFFKLSDFSQLTI